MRIAKGACKYCGSDVYLDYKANRPGGGTTKCLRCSMINVIEAGKPIIEVTL